MSGDAIAGTMRANFTQLGLNPGRNYWTGNGINERVGVNLNQTYGTISWRYFSSNYFNQSTSTFLDIYRRNYQVIEFQGWPSWTDGGTTEYINNASFFYRCIMPL